MEDSSLNKYLNLSTLHYGKIFQVFRAERDGERYIIKTLTSSSNVLQRFNQLQKEYNILSILSKKSDHFIRPITLHQWNHEVAIIWKDHNLQTLADFIRSTDIDIPKFYHISKQLAETMHIIHSNGIIHRDISTNNILIDPATLKTFIIDFGSSTYWKETEENELPARRGMPTCGTYQYMSPEHTGKLFKPIEARSDLYSLGIIFYELLTKSPPFGSLTNRVSILYAHVAMETPPLHLVVGSNVPTIIGYIICKLLEKDPERRYQNAYGLLQDILRGKHYLNEFPKPETVVFESYSPSNLDINPQVAEGQLRAIYQRNLSISREDKPPFRLGEMDYSSHICNVFKLYGRDTEISQIIGVFENVKKKTRLIFISGFSGIGKTVEHCFRSVVTQLHNGLDTSVPQSHTILVSNGKFNQYNKSIPYSGITSLLQHMMHRATEIFGYERITNSLVKELTSIQLSILSETFIPSLSCLDNSNNDHKCLSVQETHIRMRDSVTSFIKVLSKLYKHQEILLFLDDIQWADPNSLSLIKDLATTDVLRILLVCAFRDNEPVSLSRVNKYINEVTEENSDITSFKLRPLTLEATQQMCADMLRTTGGNITKLARVVAQKTNGNPFFITQFITKAFGEELLKFNFDTIEWIFDISKISSLPHTENVVTLLVSEINKLDERTVLLLQKASCIGHQFELSMLQAISGLDEETTIQYLLPALREGYIQPKQTTVPMQDSQNISICPHIPKSYSFLHDKVHESFYVSLDESEKPALHCEIGTLLLRKEGVFDIPTAKNLENFCVFAIVQHLNLGTEFISDTAVRQIHVQLNVDASNLANSSGGFSVGLEHARAGLVALQKLSNSPWEDYYTWSVELNLLLCELYYLNNEQSRAEEVYNQIHSLLTRPLDRALLLKIMTLLHYDMGNIQQAFNYGMEVLTELGAPFPEQTPDLFLTLYAELKGVLQTSSLESLLLRNSGVPVNQEVNILETIVCYLTPISYTLVNYIVWSSLPIFFILHCINKGINFECTTGNFALLGAVLQGLEGPSKQSMEFANFGWKYTSMKSPAYRITQCGIHASMCAPFFCCIEESIRIHEITYEHSKLANFPSYSGYAILFQLQQKLHFSVSLNNVLEMVEHHFPYYSKMAITHITIPLQAIFDSVHLLTDSSVNVQLPADCRRLPEKELYSPSHPPLVRVHAYQWVRTYYILNDDVKLRYATKQLNLVMNEVKGIPGSFEGPFLLCLAKIRLFRPGVDSWEDISTVATTQIEAYENYARLHEANFLCKLHLLRAEYYRISHEEEGLKPHLPDLLALYELAIDAADENNHFYIAAIAAELAYKVSAKFSLKIPAQGYLSSCISFYQLWGATNKANGLTKDLKSKSRGQQNGSVISDDSSHSPISNIILTEATKLLSSDGKPQQITQVISSLIQSHAGADAGMIILKGDPDGLFVLSQWSREKEGISVYALPGERDGEYKAFLPSTTSVSYDTIANVLSSGIMQSYGSSSEMDSKSICCLPIKSGGVIKGVAYLENSLISGAFPDSQIVMLEHLFGQIASSMEREQLRIKLEHTVAEVQTQNDMLLQLDNLKNHFVASASHELRTPLNAVLGFIEILLQDNLTDSQKTYCEMINSSAEGLLAVVNDILDFQRLQRGSIDLSMTSFLLHKDLGEVIRLLSVNRHAKKPVQLHLDYGLSDEVQIEGDRVRLQQILLKLLQNGLKFTSSGDVVLRVAEKPSQSENEIVISFEVEDTGIGISEEQESSLFQPFTQLHLGTNRQFEGTGLGLTLAQNILQAISNGTSSIKYRSIVGKGTTFYFDITFPLKSRFPHTETNFRTYLNSSQFVIASTNKYTIDSFIHLFDIKNENTKSITCKTLGSYTFSGPRGLCCIDIDSCGLLEKFDVIQLCSRLPEGWFLVLMVPALQRNQFMVNSSKCCVLIKPFCNRAIQSLDDLVSTHYENMSASVLSSVELKKPNWKGNIRVLMVEDNKMNQRVQQKLLSMIDVKCDIAANGLFGFEMFVQAIENQKKYDLILMDCHMPEVDGFESTRMIRAYEAEHNCAHTHICALTAGSEFDLCKECGMCDILSKPIRKGIFVSYFDNLFSSPSSCTFLDSQHVK